MWFIIEKCEDGCWRFRVELRSKEECQNWLTENGVVDGPEYVIAETRQYSKLVAVPKWKEIPIVHPDDEIPF